MFICQIIQDIVVIIIVLVIVRFFTYFVSNKKPVYKILVLYYTLQKRGNFSSNKGLTLFGEFHVM